MSAAITQVARSAAEIEAWLQEETAQTDEELHNGDGQDPDLVQAMRSFLNGTLSADEAAVAITRPVTLDMTPGADPYIVLQSLWGFLASAFVEMGQEVGLKLLDLLAAIQRMPQETTAITEIDWPDLQGFGHMWYDCHSSHFHGPPQLVHGENGVMAEERRIGLCQYLEDTGVVEANIWLRIPAAVAPDLGYSVLNMLRTNRPGLYVYIHQIHAWLKVAGPQLWKGKAMDELENWSSLAGDMRGRLPMTEHWAVWEAALVELSGDNTTLPKDSREVAADCLRLLKEAKKSDEKIGQVKKFDT
ncbi:unnamed protein product [Zymoseptoria tritici ST99CH_3D1]|uniref:Uncharacterized protein n=1 Tax=Zymoseptoria tritici ST99CH_1E4 TaxID=1276532 RepID=A0A2H1FJL0_ZYMTR|nr:unnamed protein product [Zymoseptoria tritici ST99CH_1E4]SMR43710.1 unnamed protein product [Zymoseptoria tritici ST99CH_3D1]